MNPRYHSPDSALLESIAGAVQRSGRLTDAVLRFVDTSLFPARPARLAAFLKGDDGASDRDSLLDLIFSPDLETQLALEPLLEAAGCTPEDEAALSDQLLARRIEARITMPNGSELARIPVPDFIKSQYLKRLNVTWQPDPLVLAAIDRGVGAAMALKVKVRLRNSRVHSAPDRQTILCRFFERMPDDDPDYTGCLDLLLSLIGSDGNDADFYDHLAAHKRFLFRSLRQAQRFEERLRRSNMETLMLQGVRTPHAPQDQLIHQMRLIDLICVSMFGKTEAVTAPMEDPLRIVTDLADPAAAVKSLMDV